MTRAMAICYRIAYFHRLFVLRDVEFICVFVFMSINRICIRDGVWLVKRLRNPVVAKCQTKAVEQINKLNERLLHAIR